MSELIDYALLRIYKSWRIHEISYVSRGVTSFKRY